MSLVLPPKLFEKKQWKKNEAELFALDLLPVGMGEGMEERVDSSRFSVVATSSSASRLDSWFTSLKSNNSL